MRIDEARRILLCLRYGIGDVVMETPVLTALRRAAPRAHLTVLGAPPAVTLLEGDPRVDALVDTARWRLRHRWDEGDERARAEIAGWVAASDFDLLLDVHHAVSAVGRAVRELGTGTIEADEAAEEAAVAEGRDGVAAIRAAVRAGWGLEVADALAPGLHLTADELDSADRLLRRHGVTRPPVAVSPVASSPLKRWPAARFAAIADWVAETTGRTPLLLCGPQADAGDEVLAAMRHPDRAVRIGPLHLRRIAALLRRCALLVCNDTGLMHMAAAVGTPVVAIFGPTSPEIYRPPAPHATGLVGRDIDCPYRNTTSLQPPGCWNADACLVAGESCICRVPVEEVLGAAGRALAG